MPVPGEIKIEHLEKAFGEILKKGIPSQKGAVNTVVKYQNIFFPIKYPITVAYKYVTGEEIPTLNESGNPTFTTHEAITFFQKINVNDIFKIYKLANI